MNEDELAAIRARAEAATPGPWSDEGSIWSPGEYGHVHHVMEWIPNGEYYAVQRRAQMEADAAFIAAARTDIPALLAALDAVTADRDRARAALEWYAAQDAAALALDAGALAAAVLVGDQPPERGPDDALYITYNRALARLMDDPGWAGDAAGA